MTKRKNQNQIYRPNKKDVEMRGENLEQMQENSKLENRGARRFV